MKDTREIQVKASRDFAGDMLRNIFAIMLLPLRPFMVIAAWIFGGRKPVEMQTVYMVRVQRSDGTIGQARIEQDIAGATMDMGDYVSIWGVERGGVLIVRRAFNHTVGAEVRLLKKLGPIMSQVILLMVIFFVIFLCLLLFGNSS